MKLQKFVPLTKMEEQGDGSLRVFGTVTAESPDLENEVCDYAGTKPQYEEVSAEQVAKTSLPGMTPSLMPFREQHNSAIVQGAGRELVFDDTAKTIKMAFDVVDANAIKKWKAGCFVGFSQGGEYLRKWEDPVFKGCMRYIARPLEVSAVDAPCLPSALVESMKGRTVTLSKATPGVTEEVHLQTSIVDPPAFDLLGSEKAVRGALTCADRPKEERKIILEAAKKAGIALSEKDAAVAKKACATIALKKGLYEVGWLGSMLEDLHWLCLQSEWEREVEDDGSKVPEGLREAWVMLLAEFKAMAIEEADELAAQGGQGEKSMKLTPEELAKAGKSIMDHLSNVKAAHEKTGEHIEKCMKACSDMVGGDKDGDKAAEAAALAKAAADAAAAGETPIQKAQREQIEALTKSVADLTKKLAETPAAGGPASGASSVAKTVDAPPELAALIQ